MLFEIRDQTPEVSPQWEPVRDSYLAGQVRESWDKAMELRGQKLLETANDYLLNIEVARACSANRTYMALVRKAFSRFPENEIVSLYRARVLLTRGLFTEGIEYMQGLARQRDNLNQALWTAELANMYAAAGFRKSATSELEKLRGNPDSSHSLALYSQSCAYEGMNDWDQAIDYAKRCVAAAPNWSRARGYLANCLLARGEVDAAVEQLNWVRDQGFEESIVDVTAALLEMSLGRFDRAREQLQNVLEHWPQAEYLKWVRRTLCIVLVETGDYEAAEAIRQQLGDSSMLPELPESPTGKHQFIPLPLIAQNHNQCVPTSVAMAVYPQGQTFDPDVMFQEMHGREGTALWRMREWVEEKGYQVQAVQLEKDAVIELLDLEVPLIGVLEGPFNSHVDVACGYNSDLETLYVRDPGIWAPAAWPWEIAFKRYELYGGLFAVIDSNDVERLAVAKKWAAVESASLLDLATAVAHGKVNDAENAFSRIPDDSPCVSIRDGYGAYVVISPIEFVERQRELLQDESANPVSRFRALMTLGPSESNQEFLEKFETEEHKKFREGAKRYFQLLSAMGQGDWELAMKTVDRLLVRGGGVSMFWELKSDILSEIGDAEGSDEAFARAVELQPLHSALQERNLSRQINKLKYAEFVERFEELVANDPNDKKFLISRANILRGGPDGKGYEQAALAAVQWFPRNPNVYQDLLAWYGMQQRSDLRDGLLDQAKQMLPVEFADADSDTKAPGNSSSSDSAGENKQPRSKEDLLKTIWTESGKERQRALDELKKMEADGGLKWGEHALFTANQLVIADDDDSVEESEKRIQSLLPADPPGTPRWYAGKLTDYLTDGNLDAMTARLTDNWLVATVPDYRNFPELWFNRVLLLEEARYNEQAIEELENLVIQFPAMESALYRLGMVRFNQRDFVAAKRHFEQALLVNPGLFGAIQMLREVNWILNDNAAALVCTRRLRKLMPYSIEYLQSEVSAVADDSPVEALDLLEKSSEDFPELRLKILRSKILSQLNRLDESMALVQDLELSAEQDDDVFEELLQAKIDLALKSENDEALANLCEIGLARWPNSNQLKVYKAQILAKDDRKAASELLFDVIVSGEADEQVCWRYLVLTDASPDEAAKRAIAKAELEVQSKIASDFASLMSEPELLAWQRPYLEWAAQKFPDNDSFLWRLSSSYHIEGRADDAIRIARQLHERHPHNPEALRTLGRCLVDKDPAEAEKYLEQAVEFDGQSGYMFDLARCYQLNKKRSKSIEMHWKVLEKDPYMSASWTNLFYLNCDKQRLWEYLVPMLQRGVGIHDEYFAVSAVLIAKELSHVLPVEWVNVAMARFESLKTLPPFQDEEIRLRRALIAWRMKRHKDFSDEYVLPSNWWQKLVAMFRWPGRSWIPKAG